MKHATQLIDQVVAESLRVKSEFFQEHKDRIVQVAENIAHGLRNGNKVLFFGNGGSAADAQHLAAEFVGRFGPDRSPLAGISLSTDTSILTALSNDYGYEKVFSRQIEALGRPGDERELPKCDRSRCRRAVKRSLHGSFDRRDRR